MKNPIDVLHEKEQELIQITRQIEALHIVLPLLAEEPTRDAFPSFSASAVKPSPRVMQL